MKKILNPKKHFLFAICSLVITSLFSVTAVGVVNGNGDEGIVNPVIPGLSGDYGAKLGGIIGGILGFLLAIAGLLSFLYLLTGGIQWITSGGDKTGVDTARQKILNAIIGLVITFGTWAIVKLVFDFLGMDFPNFSLPKLV